jgi:SAM-dependent methyltransferase
MRRRSHGPRLVEWTGERCVPWVPQVAVLYEHLHRYMWAREHASGRDVLDLGSGEGFGAAILGEVADSVHGIDVDPRAVEHSTLNYGRPAISFSVDDARTLAGLDDQSFDLVVAFEVLEHVVEHEQVLAAVERVLRPGGTLIISTPNREAYAQARGDEQNPYHLHELSEQEFAKLLSSRFASVELFAQRSQSGSVIEARGNGTPGRAGTRPIGSGASAQAGRRSKRRSRSI